MSRAELRLWDKTAKQHADFLPDWSDLAVTVSRRGDGSLTFSYPDDGINAEQLTPVSVIALTLDGVEPANCSFVYSGRSGNHLTADSELTSYTYRALPDTLRKAGFWPPAQEQTRTWTDRTAGWIAWDCMTAAITRGALSWWGYNGVLFTVSVDSEGQPWPDLIDVELQYEGKSVKDVWDWLADYHYMEYGSTGLKLDAYAKFIRGADKTGGTNPIVLFEGDQVSDAPYDATMDDFVTHLCIVGDHATVDGNVQYVYRNTAVASMGRQEKMLRVTGVKNATTLGNIGMNHLAAYNTERISRTYAVDPGDWRPLIDFKVADNVVFQTGSTQRAEKVQIISGIWDNNESVKWLVTVNDFLDDRETKLDALLTRLAGF